MDAGPAGAGIDPDRATRDLSGCRMEGLDGGLSSPATVTTAPRRTLPASGTGGRQGERRMGKYAATAVRAATLLAEGRGPAWEVWREAAAESFPESQDAREKVGPREAFLALCHAGLIRGAQGVGDVQTGLDGSRAHSVWTVQLLAAEPDLASGTRNDLWKRVMVESGASPRKRPNEHLDVALALWEAGLIDTTAVPPLR